MDELTRCKDEYYRSMTSLIRQNEALLRRQSVHKLAIKQMQSKFEDLEDRYTKDTQKTVRFERELLNIRKSWYKRNIERDDIIKELGILKQINEIFTNCCFHPKLWC